MPATSIVMALPTKSYLRQEDDFAAVLLRVFFHFIFLRHSNLKHSSLDLIIMEN